MVMMIADENSAPVSANVMVSAFGKVGTFLSKLMAVDENSAPVSANVTVMDSTPDKSGAFLPNALAPMEERGQKRTASIALLSVPDEFDDRVEGFEGVAKEIGVGAVGETEIEEADEGKVAKTCEQASRDIANAIEVVVAASDNVVMLFETIPVGVTEASKDANDIADETNSVAAPIDGETVERLAKMLEEDTALKVSEVIATEIDEQAEITHDAVESLEIASKSKWQDAGDDFAHLANGAEVAPHAGDGVVGVVFEPQVTLEVYKTIIDATTQLHACDDNEAQTTKDQSSAEWRDPTTGAAMRYAFCEEDDPDMLAMHQLFDDDDDLAQKGQRPADPLRGSAAAQVSSDELNATSQLQAAVQLSEWEDPATGVVLGFATCHDCSENQTVAPQMDFEVIPCWVDDKDSREQGVGLQMPSEWIDPKTGAMLGYEVCDEERENDNEDQSEALQIAEEWEDRNTGVVMGYACDEDSDVGDHTDEHHTMPKASADLQKPHKKASKCRKRLSTRRLQPLVLQFRKFHLKAVRESSDSRRLAKPEGSSLDWIQDMFERSIC